jgi:D-alanyl-D-alanine carboxypeptidase
VPPSRLVEMGLAAPRTNPPGALHAYSNTNYVLAGLILERVTGRPAEFEISRRILWPLGLWQTYFPGRLPYIIGPHSKGYVPWIDGQLRDFSVYNMSFVWMAGDLISTARDLDRFYAALLTGRLLRAAEQAQMLTTVPFVPAHPEFGGYGLGIFRIARPCGGEVWGHNGVVFGYWSISLHTSDASRQVTLGMNMTHYAPPTEIHPIDVAVGEFLTTTLCGPPAPTAAEPTRTGPPLRLPNTGLASVPR